MNNILLLHGALGHSAQFDVLKQKLEHIGFAVHTILFDGHGNGEIPEKGITIDYYTNQLAQFLNQNNLENLMVFGYSLGGFVAINHAVLFPGKIKSIITLATKFNWSPEIAAQEIKMLQPQVIQEKVPQYAAHLAAIHGENKWQHLIHAIANLMTNLGMQEILTPEKMQTIQIPIQYMVGDKDAMVTINETIEQYKQTSFASFAVLPNTKHPFEKVDVDLLLHLILNFAKLQNN